MNEVPWLRSGSGRTPADGGCVMQIADWISRNEWTDQPPCVHPVIRALAIEVNDRLDDEGRQRLLDLIPRMMDTAGSGDALTRRLLAYLARRSYPLYSAWAEKSGYDDGDAVLACIEAAEQGEAAEAALAALAAVAALAALAAVAALAAEAAEAALAALAARAAVAARAAEAALAAEAAVAARAAVAAEAARAAEAALAARAAEAAPDYLGLLVGLLDRYDELVPRTMPVVDFVPVCRMLEETRA